MHRPESAHPEPQLTDSRDFRHRFFPDVGRADWTDWQWQLRNRIRDGKSLARVLRLTDDERSALDRHRGPLPVGITPYYASLLDAENASSALRRTVVMTGAEYQVSESETADPLSEDRDQPVPGIVHRYPDRVLFLVTGFCPVYCRYCTRSRMVGYPGGEYRFNTDQWQAGLDYIAAHSGIRDVLISGGDPLTLADDKLEWLLSGLRKIPHVEFLRIGSKIPAALPFRITKSLVRMMKRYHPLWMSLHFTHPDEITPEVALACNRLADAGIPLGSQTVLLRGVNDDVDTLRQLFLQLLRLRVRPYYLYQCDPVSGSAHFRVPIDRAVEIMRGLRGHITGYAVPTLVVDLPGGGGKVPLVPEYVAQRDGNEIWFTNYQGETFRYVDR
ncbi:MAG: KamA family radical SAM protein [Pirellulales bacterium]